MSKGSSPRPYSVDHKTFSSNWETIFAKNKVKCPECGSTNLDIEFCFTAGVETFYKVCMDCDHQFDPE